MASIQVPNLIARAYHVTVFPAPTPAAAPAVSTPAPAPKPQTLPTDTVTISNAGLAASSSYLQTMLQLYQETDEQLTLLAQGGSTLAQEILTQRRTATNLPGITPQGW